MKDKPPKDKDKEPKVKLKPVEKPKGEKKAKVKLGKEKEKKKGKEDKVMMTSCLFACRDILTFQLPEMNSADSARHVLLGIFRMLQVQGPLYLFLLIDSSIA